MSHENTDTPLSVDMRQAALAAPSAAIERRELIAAQQQAARQAAPSTVISVLISYNNLHKRKAGKR